MAILHRKLARDIRGEKARYFAVALLVFLGMTVYTSIWFSYKGLDQSYLRTSEELKYNDIFVRAASAPDSGVAVLAALPGVEAVAGRLAVDTGGRMPDGSEIKVHLIGVPTAERPAVNDLYMESGEYFRSGDSAACIIESHLVDYYGFEPGDRVTVQTSYGQQELEVRGTGASSEYFVLYSEGSEYLATADNFGVIFVPQAWLQGAMGMPGQVNEYGVNTVAEADREAVLAAVQAALPRGSVVYAALGDEHPARELLDIDVKMFKDLSEFFPILFLIVAAFSLYMVITRLVFSQRKTIGTMMSCGMKSNRIALHYLSYSVMIWAVGSMLGVVAGYFLAQDITRMYADSMGIPLVTAGMDWGAAFLGCAVTLVVCVAAGWVPLVKLLKQTPAEVLKGENEEAASHHHLAHASHKDHRRGFVDRALPFLEHLSLTATLPLRNLGRNRRRTIFNAVTFIFAVALILVSVCGLDSMNRVIDFHFKKYINYDAEVAFAEPVTLEQVEGLVSIDGIERAEARTQVPARFARGGEIIGQGVIDVLPAGEELLRLYDSDMLLQGLPADGALASNAFRDSLGVKEGDLIEVESLLGVAFRVPVLGFVEQLGGMNIYASQEYLAGMFGYDPSVEAVATGAIVKSSLDRKELRSRLLAYGGAAVTSVIQPSYSEESIREEYMGMMYLFCGIMILFALAMAMAVIYNAVSIAFLERRREISTMLAMGCSVRRLGGMMTVENLMVGVASIIPGLFLGYLLSIYMMEMWQNEYWTMPAYLQPMTYAAAAGCVLALILLMQLPDFRKASRMDVVAALRERTG